eukprot:scaffold110880_cov34-Cyclotella_meneghiniana.AAC.1
MPTTKISYQQAKESSSLYFLFMRRDGSFLEVVDLWQWCSALLASLLTLPSHKVALSRSCTAARCRYHKV